MLLTKTAAVLNEVALSYHKVRGLYFLAVVFEATIGTFCFMRLAFNDIYQVRVKVGLGIYTFGQLCNLWHHYILSGLRTPGSFKYVIPSGGLFSFVICPQYFGYFTQI